jgi:hypothetical protein
MANVDWVVVIKNNSGSNVVLPDLGYEIGNGITVTLSDFFTYGEITDSTDLQAQVLAGNLVVNNGVVDLSASNGVDYIIRDNIYRDMQTHYTKDELANINGGGSVDWSNITNAPSFGSPTWVGPVLYRVTAVGADAPATPAEGDVYVDTDDNHYYKRVGAAWVDQGSALVGDRIINLTDGTEDIYSFTGANTWADGGQAVDNQAVMVNDDGDGKNAQYIYSTESNVWIKIADVDFNSHFDGGANKHDASEIDVEGTYLNLGAPADLETVLSNIETAMVEAIDNNTLDMAYDQGGAGAGRLITADTGSVKIDSAAATTAPFEIVPKAALPTTGLADGQLAIKDGILCIYDSTRAKWLSVQREFLVFGRAGSTKNQYLNFGVGAMPSNNAGYRMQRDATIVSISGQLDAIGTCDLNVRRNDTATNILTLAITSALGNASVSANVDVSATDFLQAYLSTTTAGSEDPVMIVEIAWRP